MNSMGEIGMRNTPKNFHTVCVYLCMYPTTSQRIFTQNKNVYNIYIRNKFTITRCLPSPVLTTTLWLYSIILCVRNCTFGRFIEFGKDRESEGGGETYNNHFYANTPTRLYYNLGNQIL